MSARFAAVDLGASSGRVMVGEVGPDTLRLTAAARFPNAPVPMADGLHWDIHALVDSATQGLATAYAEGPLVSIGVDSWAVDYGLLHAGRLVGQPFHYRDERRSSEGPRVVAAAVGAQELYGRNGLQHLPFNTIYQLAADDAVPEADRLLLVPDLVAWALTGNIVAERTNASTTGLLNVRSREWDAQLMVRLGLKVALFPHLVDPGHQIGTWQPPVSDRGDGRIPVVAVGSHDTASAVVGVPMQVIDEADDAAYVSLGTWALAGLELDQPVLTEEARLANFTNEGGVDGTVRFLTNVMGTWLLSETLRTWGETDLADMLRAAATYDLPVPVVDVQDQRFLPPSNKDSDMATRIADWCIEHGVEPPRGRVATVRCIVVSIATALATALERASELAGRSVGVVHVVGGGARNTLLCQAIADRTHLPVLAGPIEATAIGNLLVQARAAGLVGPTLADLRALVARTQDLTRFEPRG